MDDLERIPVGVEYIGGIVSRIVFQSCAGRNVVPGTSGHCGLVEFIDLVFIFGHETPVNGCWIRLPLLYPEERLLAVTKSPQVGMTVFALVRHEEFDVKRLQGRLIEGQRAFDIADGQNNVVEHRSPPQITSASRAAKATIPTLGDARTRLAGAGLPTNARPECTWSNLIASPRRPACWHERQRSPLRRSWHPPAAR